MEVTKAKAAEILGISTKEVVRRIESGEIKAKKKTSSKFSDWVITLPDHKRDREKVAKMVTKKIEEKKVKLSTAKEIKKVAKLPIPETEEIVEQESELKICSRCGKPIEEGIDSDVCGTCADDLREEQKAKEAESEPVVEEESDPKEEIRKRVEERRNAEQKAKSEREQREARKEGNGKKGRWFY